MLLLLFSFFQYLHQAPALALAKGAGFHDLDGIPDSALVIFVMGHELGRFGYKLSVNRVFHPAFDHYGNGFIHFVTYDLANSDLPEVSCYGIFAHDLLGF